MALVGVTTILLMTAISVEPLGYEGLII